LESIKSKLLEEDMIGIITLLTENNYKMTEKNGKNKLKWREIMSKAHEKTLENSKIEKLLSNFDHERCTFKLT
jgi:hypothetical protein